MNRLSQVFILPVALLSTPLLAEQPQGATQPPAAKLDRKDPNFVRCVSQVETGSLVKKRKICRTNAEWSKIDAAGNQDAEDLLSRTRQGFDPRGNGL